MRFAGERMKRIRLQKPVTTRTGSGQETIDWQDADNDPNPFALVRDDRGDENYQADKKTAFERKFFQVHMRDDVDVTWTVLDDESGKRFDITRIFPIGARKLDIQASYTQGQYDD